MSSVEAVVFSRENPFTLHRGTDLPTEISCYSLPYGGLGFTSHVLTYYTIACLGYGRKPLWPFKAVDYGRVNIALGAVGLVVGFVLSTITMVRCRNTWQLLVLGVWKFSMSLFNGIVGVHVAAAHFHQTKGEDQTRGETRPWKIDKAPKYREVFFWFAIYVPGMIAGFVGLISLVVLNWSDGPQKLHTVTLVFGIPAAICVCLILHGLCSKYGTKSEVLVGFSILLPGFLILSVIYGDWALGAMTNNLVGAPTDNKALYYLYWISKRFTMFSW